MHFYFFFFKNFLKIFKNIKNYDIKLNNNIKNIKKI